MAPGSWLEGPIVGFDLETTGLDPSTDEPVSYAFVTYVGRRQASVETGYVLPEQPISAGASAVHGLTVTDLEHHGATTVAEGVAHIARRLSALSAEGIPIVGCNLFFDLTIVDRLCARWCPGLSLSAAHWQGPALDVLVLDRALDDDFVARPKRRLALLCDHYGVDAPTHAAASDAGAAVAVLLEQSARFTELTDQPLEELHRRQFTWHARWRASSAADLDERQLQFFDIGESWPFAPVTPGR